MSDKSKTKSQLLDEINELHQRVAELEARTSEAPFYERDINQTIIDVSPAFIVVVGADGKTRMMNKSMLKALGFSEQEVIGRDYLSILIPEREQDQIEELFEKQLLQGESTLNRNHVLTKGDGELLVEWQGRPILNRNGEVELFIGVGLDITKHKQVEEVLRENEERFRGLTEATFEGIAITENGIVIDANERIAEMLGYSPDEMLGMNVMEMVVPESRELVKERILSGYEAPYEHLAIRKDKSILYVEVRGKALSYKGRNARVTSIRDIAAHKRAEQELQRISQHENKRREELEKLREISTSLRQAEGSTNLLEVFTKEVQEFCNAEVVASLQFKELDAPVFGYKPDGNIKLDQKQYDAITSALLDSKKGELTTVVPGFDSVLVLALQSSETMYGAVLVASRASEAFTPDEQNVLNAIADMAGTALHRIDILETLEERVQRRTHDLVVLYNLITIISENWRLQDILELSLMLTLETVKANRGIIYLVDGKELQGLKPIIQRGFSVGFSIDLGSLPEDEGAHEVLKLHKPVNLDNVSEIPGYARFDGLSSYAGIPILVRGELRGVFSLFANGKGVFGSDEMALLASIADHLGIGIDNSILWEQSRESAALEERNRLARNLHDSVSQQLYSLTLMAGSTKKMLERDHDLEAIKQSVSRLGETAHQALKEMRLLLYELRPAVLDSEGLVRALQHRVETVEGRLGVIVHLQAKELPDLPSDVEDALYHIALEALNNVVKHSKGTEADIKFIYEDGSVLMEISDNGKGFDTDRHQEGLGLRNMRERGQMLGGEVDIDSTPGNGTQVTVTVKVPTVSMVES